jgi:hypothetical protein
MQRVAVAGYLDKRSFVIQYPSVVSPSRHTLQPATIEFNPWLSPEATVFESIFLVVDRSYQRIRRQRGTRQGFFQDIFALTKYLLFESWQHLLDFMLDDSSDSSRA